MDHWIDSQADDGTAPDGYETAEVSAAKTLVGDILGTDFGGYDNHQPARRRGMARPTLSMADPEDVPDGFENDSYDDEVAKEVVVKY